MDPADDVLLPDASTQLIKLRDGRSLSFIDCGAKCGSPVLLFHPVLGGRYLASALSGDAIAYNLRLICPDRPGYGLSTAQPGRSVLGFAEDIVELLTHLNIVNFSIWAASAGAQYALACVESDLLRHRILGRIVLMGPWVPVGSPGVKAITKLGGMAPSFLLRWVAGSMPATVQKQWSCSRDKLLERSWTPSELLFWEKHPELHTVWGKMLHEVTAAGTEGFIQDVMLCFGRPPLGFEYASAIKAHSVLVYHGAKDTLVPIAAMQWLQREGATVVEVEDGSHDGILLTQAGAVFGAIAEDVSKGALLVRSLRLAADGEAGAVAGERLGDSGRDEQEG